MNFYFAPIEGLSGHIYRNAHRNFFNHMDRYYSPFVSANESGQFRKRERNDLDPENNSGLVLIPQILTNKAQDFILYAERIRQMGYDEINLNLGCPSGTVVSKNKGSGFLALPEELDAFLYEIFAWGRASISIKTRIGMEHPEEFFRLLGIFNKYPVCELIIHPRVRTDHYKNKPNMEIFRYALQHSKNPVCYNGNLFTANQYRVFSEEYPDVKAVMLGRGLLVNPGLAREIRTGEAVDKNAVREFHEAVYAGFRKELSLSGEVTILHKMKELWFYLIRMFSDHEKYAKKIRKSTRLADYEDVVSHLFREQELLEDYERNLEGV